MGRTAGGTILADMVEQADLEKENVVSRIAIVTAVIQTRWTPPLAPSKLLLPP